MRSVKGPLKDHQSRYVPINDTLLPILEEWLLVQGGGRVLFPPSMPTRGGKPGSPPRYIREYTIGKHFKNALREARLDDALTWYQCTRHTFASHWVMGGEARESGL
jgi:integrase